MSEGGENDPFAKPLYGLTPVPRVRIPPSPPFLFMPRGLTARLRTGLHVARRPSRGGNVALLGVIHHHAIGIEPPAERTDRPLHALDPASWKSIAIPLVVQRDHFFAQRPHQVFSVASIMNVHIRMRSAGSNGKAVHAIECFCPPAIKDGEVQSAVQHHFLPARA